MWGIDSSWTLFLDRDGVINKRFMNDYVLSPAGFFLLPDVEEAIHAFNSIFVRTIVVTNQQGIAKKIMTEGNLFEIHAYCSELLAMKNAYIDHYFFAPESSSNPSHRRKPRTAMAVEAKEMFPEIDFSKSIMVGDTDSDIEFGKNNGMKTVFIAYTEQKHPSADLTVNSLFELKGKLKL